jgi:hypothetical protein
MFEHETRGQTPMPSQWVGSCPYPACGPALWAASTDGCLSTVDLHLGDPADAFGRLGGGAAAARDAQVAWFPAVLPAAAAAQLIFAAGFQQRASLICAFGASHLRS